jgi:hypothetical protein
VSVCVGSGLTRLHAAPNRLKMVSIEQFFNLAAKLYEVVLAAKSNKEQCGVLRERVRRIESELRRLAVSLPIRCPHRPTVHPPPRCTVIAPSTRLCTGLRNSRAVPGSAAM